MAKETPNTTTSRTHKAIEPKAPPVNRAQSDDAAHDSTDFYHAILSAANGRVSKPTSNNKMRHHSRKRLMRAEKQIEFDEDEELGRLLDHIPDDMDEDEHPDVNKEAVESTAALNDPASSDFFNPSQAQGADATVLLEGMEIEHKHYTADEMLAAEALVLLKHGHDVMEAAGATVLLEGIETKPKFYTRDEFAAAASLELMRHGYDVMDGADATVLLKGTDTKHELHTADEMLAAEALTLLKHGHDVVEGAEPTAAASSKPKSQTAALTTATNSAATNPAATNSAATNSAATNSAAANSAAANSAAANSAAANSNAPPGTLSANDYFVVGNPRPLGALFPVNRSQTRFEYVPYTQGGINFNIKAEVMKLNRWKQQKLRRINKRLGIKVDGRSTRFQ